MPEKTSLSSDQVLKAIEETKKLKPNYAGMLDFYEKIFVAQENSKSKTRIEPLEISESVLALKAKEKFPIIEMSQFSIDGKAAGKLFRILCDIAQTAAGETPQSAAAIANAVDEKKLDLNALFLAFLKADEQFFEKVADELKIDKKLLAFISYNSVKPSLVLCAQQLATHLDKEQPWENGYCPICGAPPVISMFEDNGHRFLFCSFCWHKWSAKRIYCPYCGNADHDALQYFDIEEEYRIDVCDKCKKYIKTVDARKTDRVIYPPLEQLSTPHIDIKAAELGLINGIALGY